MLGEFDKDAVIEDVLSSGVLGESTHQIALFKHLINAKFEGKIRGMKGYSIAVDVFGRDKDFDGSVDSIVRVEMFRLRANLREFNQLSKRFQLKLAKASYDIQVSKKIDFNLLKTTEKLPNPPQTSAKTTILKKWVTSIIFIGVPLLTFLLGRISTHIDAPNHCSKTLPNVSIVNNSKTFDLEVYFDQTVRAASSQFSQVNITDNIEACRTTGVPNYEIQYTLFQEPNSYRATISAVSDQTGQILASTNFTGNLKSEAVNSQTYNDELYYNVVKAVNDLVKPNGVIPKDAMTAQWADPARLKDYSCVPIMYESFVSDSDATYLETLKCLEDAYKNETPAIGNLGGLAASYLEQDQGYRARTVEDPFQSASTIMDIIGENWSQNTETTMAKIHYESERHDYNSQRMRDVLLKAETRFSSNPNILLEIARQSGFRVGDWKHAKRISNRAKRLSSERDNSVFFTDAAYSLLFEEPKLAMDTCTLVYSENSALANLIVNACAVKSQNELWQKRSNKNLQRLELSTKQQKIEFINNQQMDETLKGEFIEIWKNQS